MRFAWSALGGAHGRRRAVGSGRQQGDEAAVPYGDERVREHLGHRRAGVVGGNRGDLGRDRHPARAEVAAEAPRRLHELTGLDPHDPEDRERLGLALKGRDVADAVRAP